MPISFLRYIQNRKVILSITILYTLAITTVLLHRFWQYEVFYYDHGVFEQAAYKLSRFEAPFYDGTKGLAHVYIDHVFPSLQVTLAPFYWIWDSYETPIIVLALFIGLSVLLGYEIGKTLKVNEGMLLSLLFAYMLFIGLQNALIFYVHDVTMQIPFLMLLFLSLVKRRFKLYYPLLLFNLGFKETVAVVGTALGVALLFFGDKTVRKHAFLTIGISFAYALLATRIIVPWANVVSFGFWGKYGFPPEAPKHIWEYATKFFNTAQKQETLFTSFITFGFLPALSPFSLILVFQDFAQRFVLIDHPFRQGLNLHYNANLAVLLFVGSLFTVAKFQKYAFYRKIITVHALSIIITVLYLHQIKYHGPLGLLYNRDFFAITKQQQFMNDFIAKIPKTGKIMTQSNLAVRFTHNTLYLLTSKEHLFSVNPDVVALDFRDGQNINNYWPLDQGKMASIAAYLRSRSDYTAIFAEPHRYVFVKKK